MPIEALLSPEVIVALGVALFGIAFVRILVEWNQETLEHKKIL